MITIRMEWICMSGALTLFVFIIIVVCWMKRLVYFSFWKKNRKFLLNKNKSLFSRPPRSSNDRHIGRLLLFSRTLSSSFGLCNMEDSNNRRTCAAQGTSARVCCERERTRENSFVFIIQFSKFKFQNERKKHDLQLTAYLVLFIKLLIQMKGEFLSTNRKALSGVPIGA